MKANEAASKVQPAWKGFVKVVGDIVVTVAVTAFSEANFNGFKLKNTIFYKCGFYNFSGTPTIDGNYEIIEPDLSPGFDASQVVGGEQIF